MSEATINAIVTAIVTVTGAIATAAITALGLYINFKLKMIELSSRLTAAESREESYKGIVKDSLTIVETLANEKLASEGKPKLVPLAAVVPEHNSPVTSEQQDMASLATIRAKLVAATLALGLPPRTPTDPETETQRAERLRAGAAGKAGADSPDVLASKLAVVVATDLKADIAEVGDKVDAMPEKIAEKLRGKAEPNA